MNVLVIGNAPVKDKLGNQVDKFDMVIRINKYRSGYEEYIGHKIDIWSVGAIIPIKESRGGECPVLAVFPYHSYYSLFEKIKKIYGDRVAIADTDVIERLQHKIGYEHLGTFTTTGLTTIELAWKMYGAPIYTLGFEFITPPENYYIWGGLSSVKKLPCHYMDADKMYYDNLIKLQIVKKLEL